VKSLARSFAAWRERLRGGRGRLALDLLICAALLAFTLPAVRDPDVNGRITTLGTVLLPAVILPILLRHRTPLVAAAALAAGSVISGIPTFDQFRVAAAVPAAVLIAYSLGRRAALRAAVAGLTLILAGMVVIGATDVALRGDDGGGVLGLVIFTFPLCSGIWVAGRLVRSREHIAGQLAERSLQLEHQREQTAALAVEEERARLASDLDAVVRTRLRAMIDLAAGGGASAPAVFARIESLGREALNEMRGLLGVLRSDDRGERSPRPTMAQLDALLAEARTGGSSVTLEVEGDREPLSTGLELAAYRTVQHALVAVAGTGERPVTVRLSYGSDAFEVEVRGAPADGGVAAAALMAARERVTAHGGTFSTDTPVWGQQVLRAWLPRAVTGV